MWKDARKKRFWVLSALPIGLIMVVVSYFWPPATAGWSEEQAVEHQRVGLELHAMAHMVGERQSQGSASQNHPGNQPAVTEAEFAQQQEKWEQGEAAKQGAMGRAALWGQLLHLTGFALVLGGGGAFVLLSHVEA